ncbi:hypothetical protein LJB82_03610, partial [Desulfovibrio sp. OttesenSCG-928-M16]|nr:hypothetical protein [Desulfovibrio sp. OttesenSCG-928-M16]
MAKTFTRVRNALLMPLTGTLDNFSAGVFADGVCLPASLQERASAAKALPPLRHLPGDYIFGGYFFHHYGHFMLESLSRLYAIKQCKKLPLLFMCLQKTIPQQHAEIFQL